MKRITILAGLAVSASAFAQFNGGNLVVTLVDNGLADNNACAGFMRQVTTGFAPVGADVTLPITFERDEASEAQLYRTGDATRLSFGGYEAAAGTPDPGGTSIRQAYLVTKAGTLIGGTRWTVAATQGDSVRGGFSPDGNGFFITGGDAGVFYIPFGSFGDRTGGFPGTLTGINAVVNFSTAKTNNPTLFSSSRQMALFNGDLYYTSSDDSIYDGVAGSNTVYRIPGAPTNPASPIDPTQLFGFNNSPRGIVMLDANTALVATTTTARGISKWTRNPVTGIWSFAYGSAITRPGGALTPGNNIVVHPNGKIYVTWTAVSGGLAVAGGIAEFQDTGVAFTQTNVVDFGPGRFVRGLSLAPAILKPISGNVNLGPLVPGPAGQAISFQVRPTSSSAPVLEFRSAALDASGNYTFNIELEPGTYNIRAKGSNWLAQAQNVVVSASGATSVNFVLKNGDVNGDNIIDGLDLGAMDSSFNLALGEPGFNASADLNRDDVVDGLDLGILDTNFNEAGDE